MPHRPDHPPVAAQPFSAEPASAEPASAEPASAEPASTQPDSARTPPAASPPARPSWPARLPFYYGWIIIAIAFVTLGLGVTARTAFSLLLPPLLDEFGWDRGLTAGAFSFGFLVSAALSPIMGRALDVRGPRPVILTGVVLVVVGLALSPLIVQPWHLYATLGLLVGAGANLMAYSVHSQFLPNWFVRRRGLAISIAFAGAGAGAIVLLPWIQSIILTVGWRAACTTMALLMLIAVPLNLLVRNRPEDLGLRPDGSREPALPPGRVAANVVDPAWVAVDWTLARALRTARFWWIAVGYFSAMIAWYAVQVHQTKYLVEIGFSPTVAGWALGAVVVAGIPGQIVLGLLSDRLGREWAWTAGCAGFAICYVALIALEHAPTPALFYLMVASQGFLGYAMPAVMGPIVAEIFEGRHFGAVFGTLAISVLAGGAAGPWIAGALYDLTGGYRTAFVTALACSVLAGAAIWIAAPRKVRLVPGRVRPSAPGR